MSRSYWSDPSPREPVVPIVVVLSTLGFAAVLGYEVTKLGLTAWEWLRRATPEQRRRRR